MTRLAILLTTSLALVLVACGDDDGSSNADAAIQPDATVQSDAAVQPDATLQPDAGADAGTTCPREPGPADAIRRVVVSHPYDTDGNESTGFEVLDLSSAGELTRPGTTFTMGRASMGEIAFTPDGVVGIAAHDEDGTLGVFTLDSAGQPTVVHARFEGSFYAARVIMAPAGDRAWVLDSQWRENGGGIYEVAIGCDGQLTDLGRVVESRLPGGMGLLPDGSGRAVVAAADLLDSTAGNHAHLVSLGDPPARLASSPAFPDEEAIVASATVTADGRFFLIGDNSAYSGVPNRVAVVEVLAGSLEARQVLTPIEDPVALVASPGNDLVLVASGYGDALFLLAYDPLDAVAPFTDLGELAYVGGSPELPSGATMIARGSLTGLVLVAELSGVRPVQLDLDGGALDLGRFFLGDGLENIVGVIGVQP